METEHPLREYCVYIKKHRHQGFRNKSTLTPNRFKFYLPSISCSTSWENLVLYHWRHYNWYFAVIITCLTVLKSRFFFLQGEVCLAMLFNLAQSSSRQVIITLNLLEKTKRQTSWINLSKNYFVEINKKMTQIAYQSSAKIAHTLVSPSFLCKALGTTL